MGGNVHCFVGKLLTLWDFIQTIQIIKSMTRNNWWNYVFVIAAGRVSSAQYTSGQNCFKIIFS